MCRKQGCSAWWVKCRPNFKNQWVHLEGEENSVCLVSKCVYLLIFQVHIVYNIKYYAIYITIMWYIDVYKIVWWDIIWINTSFQRNLFFKKNSIADFCCTLPFGIQESLGQVPYLPYFPKWTERVSTQMTTALSRFFLFFKLFSHTLRPNHSLPSLHSRSLPWPTSPTLAFRKEQASQWHLQNRA